MGKKQSGFASKSDSKGSMLGTLSKVLSFIGHYKVFLFCSVLLSALTVCLQLYVPILFGDAIDCIIGEGRVDTERMVGFLWKILVVIACSGVASTVMNLFNNRLTYSVVRDIRKAAVRKIQRLPLSYLDGHSSGDIISRVVADTDQLSDGLLLGFTQLFAGVVQIFVTLVFMLHKSALITLLVILLTPLSFVVARFIATRSFTMFQKQAGVRGTQTGLINEMVGNEKLVKAFGYEETASRRFAGLNEDLRKYSQEAVFFSSLTNPSTRAVNNVIYAIVALAGAWLILGGSLTVGGLSALLSYANQYMKPFNDISSVITELQNALACASRVFEFLEQEDQSPDAKEELPLAKGEVDIQEVAFSYDPEKPLIENFSLHVMPGTRVAIAGPTGCGKTTFINLLMRFYDVDHGSIRVDGSSIMEVSRGSLRRGYGMVLQETWLKEDTVRANITFGKPDASEEEIVAACKAAHSWEFIRRLPNRLDTVLTEDSLSQGQKQLLCITRVMLALPPMLILDEATSSIDTRTELQIQEAFDTMMKGRTSFIVAHRLSTIQGADVILVMKDGKIIEQGSHQALLDKGGFYHDLYYSQFAMAQ